MPIDSDAARALLDDTFRHAERHILENTVPNVEPDLVASFDTIFQSKTQAYREVLVGCAIARIQNRGINIRLPYVRQGSEAFNGRTLDERVVNPRSAGPGPVPKPRPFHDLSQLKQRQR